MQLNNLLTYLLNENLDEVAKSLADAQGQKLALYRDNYRLILIDPDAFFKELKSVKGDVSLSLNSGIVGYIRFEPAPECSEAKKTYQVSYSAALKGWGPLMYDIAMSVLHPNYLTADRNSNSADADKIWTYYLKNRSDVNKELMEELVFDDGCELPESTSETVDNKLEQARDIITKNNENKPRLTMVDRAIARRQGKPPDDERLMDAIEEIKKVLADVPQAWRYQIETPMDISELDNQYKLFIKKALSEYKANITPDIIKTAAARFFNSMYYT